MLWLVYLCLLWLYCLVACCKLFWCVIGLFFCFCILIWWLVFTCLKIWAWWLVWYFVLLTGFVGYFICCLLWRFWCLMLYNLCDCYVVILLDCFALCLTFCFGVVLTCVLNLLDCAGFDCVFWVWLCWWWFCCFLQLRF